MSFKLYLNEFLKAILSTFITLNRSLQVTNIRNFPSKTWMAAAKNSIRFKAFDILIALINHLIIISVNFRSDHVETKIQTKGVSKDFICFIAGEWQEDHL